MSFIHVDNVWKEYTENVVLEHLTLRVKKGEFVTIVGASGCGKTTFLKMLLGEVSPSRGKILLDGKPLAVEPGPDRGIVFQRYSVFPHLKVLGNVMLGLELQQSRVLGRLFGDKRRLAQQLACEMLEAVGLSHVLDKYPSELSGGMQQRLALAQSLIKQPLILLLDEPFGALDPGMRADMHQLILTLWRNMGLTVFMVSHDLKESFYLGTRLLVFDKVRHDPQNMNAFGARVTYDIPLGSVDNSLCQEIEKYSSPKQIVANLE
ncbi:MAG: ABC transporter ATP-binding protein [Gammaproteobacteria bacterium]|nr:ABC transporter ATP-binding protein [Gammaproteobacteria bacterium]